MTKLEIHFAPTVEWRVLINKSNAAHIDSYHLMKTLRQVLRVGIVVAITFNAAALPKVGPEYKEPTNNVPEVYKALDLGKWKEGKPADNITKGRWWEIFNDEALNTLEERATIANPDLQAAFARVEQARATARMSRSELLPNVAFNPSIRRERYSPNQEPAFGAITVNSIRVPLDLSYEIDLWGRIRRNFEATRANAQATLAAYHNVMLTLQGDVAQSYFSIRALDAEIDTVTRTVGLRDEQLKLVQSRFQGGIGNELDVARAETQLAATESELAELLRRRVELENGLAVLLGEFPSNFKLAPLPASSDWKPAAPEVPPGLPSELLERRPDVAQAERDLAAANARIGAAKASYFPVVTLTGSGGYLSAEFDSLFDWSSHIWSIGPTVSMPIFAQARNRANVRRTRAAFAEAAARYRSQVLVAFSEVENNLAAIRYLSEQAAAQERAVVGSVRAATLANQRYQSGISNYLEVVDANRVALASQRILAQLAGQRLIASVQLIKALGGGWNRYE